MDRDRAANLDPCPGPDPFLVPGLNLHQYRQTSHLQVQWIQLIHMRSISDQLSGKQYLFSRVLRDSTPRYVGPLVGRLVGRSVPFFTFFGVF